MKLGAGLALVVLIAFAICASQSAIARTDKDNAARADFAQIATVLRHPRCLNCHPSGDFPRVGDDARQHPQNVRRGPDGHGSPGLRCDACHQNRNQPLAGVPGAPHWKLAPISMAWEGLDDRALAAALKDRTKNGDRELAALEEHMAKDPLVGWAWDPGPGRSPPPISREEFVRVFHKWIEAGAPLP